MRRRGSSETWNQAAISRRAFVASGLALCGMPAARVFARQAASSAWTPFTLGVASGDPSPDGVVLWTRLAPDPLAGGGMPQTNVDVQWQIALDDKMTRVVQQGVAVATPAWGHSVHVEVAGLAPNRWYWYRFRSAGHTSPVGRTRTMPAAGAVVDRLRFAFVSCQHYETGFFTAYEHLAAEELDLVFHLGDYIYEDGGRSDQVRRHTEGEIKTLDQYRNRYAQYRMDLHLQAAHALCPWIVTPDDHEVDNNYAGKVSEFYEPDVSFLLRRAAAYQAYYEHMPLRRRSVPRGPDILLYRGFSYGALASFFVLDTRQYRTDQPCNDVASAPCAQVGKEEGTLLGPAQELWLNERLRASRAQWNILPQQIMVAPVDQAPGRAVRLSMDQWSGYDLARGRLVDALGAPGVSNPVVLTGDIHSSWVNDLTRDFRNERSPVVATEFVGTSITSGGDGTDITPALRTVMSENPFVKFYNGQRGYVSCELTPKAMRATYQVVDYVRWPGSPMHTRAAFVVESGKPGAQNG